MQSYSLPSNRYIDLTLGTSGSTYTAPADGWFILGGNNGYAVFDMNNGMASVSQYIPGWFGAHAYIPVEKGEVVYAYPYNLTDVIFRFIYAVGSQPA